MSLFAKSIDLPAWAAFGLRLIKRLALALLILVAIGLLLELASPLFFSSRSTRYLIEGGAHDPPAWTENPFFTYRFYPGRLAPAPLPIVARHTPSNNTIRICLLGGSTAMGMPEPAFGLGRQLERMLRHRYPDQTIELIPMGYDGANSHVLREVARDLQRLNPQAVIVLTGNDEVAGPYGPTTRLGRLHSSSRIARGMVLFSRTRLAQLIAGTFHRIFPARIDQMAWQRQEPITLRGRLRPRDPHLKTVARSFRKNLDAILTVAEAASPAVMVCTVPVNLRDCAPFSTPYLTDEAAAQEVRETLRAAAAATAATNRFEATRLYAHAIQLNPDHAEALFRAARLALDDNRSAEAAALFSRARDADALRLRADSKLNALIRECADGRSASLLDAEALFAIRSPQGIPGRELFLDHIHLTFSGNYLLASALVHRMEFMGAIPAAPTAHIPTVGDMAEALLYHPWGRAAQIEALMQQQLRTPFRRQTTNAETLARLKEEWMQWDERVAAFTPDTTRAIFDRHLASHPDNAWLAIRTAWHLLKANALGQAETAATAAYSHWPHRFDTRALLALTRACQGQEARQGIDLLRGPPGSSGYYDIHFASVIGQHLLERGQLVYARPWLSYAIERDKWNSDAVIALAETLHRLDGVNQRTATQLRQLRQRPHPPFAWTIDWLSEALRLLDQDQHAVGLLQDAIKRNPRNPLLWEELAVLHTLLGDWKTAFDCYTRSEELAPYRYERYLKWADAMFRLRQYRRAKIQMNRYQTYMPDDPDALELQERIDAKLPAQPESTDPDEDKPARRFLWE
ncbi:MAG: hypothetical protein RBT03_03025 [Kiritimatiellia bacterium]|jgi:tetratricopeptide (TPR) repeat protein|nr:hypothetical protein [Kiritimatiellia bacterium]